MMANRENIYYWKCDRPHAFFAIEGEVNGNNDIRKGVEKLLSDFFGGSDFIIKPANGQGNHITYLAERGGTEYFVRIENGPEGDDYMEVEAEVMNRVRAKGIPTPVLYSVDSSRKKYPFAFQIMEKVGHKDLNDLNKSGGLRTEPVLRSLGAMIAGWQVITGRGFGPFNAEKLRNCGQLEGLHSSYEEYFYLNLDKHLAFLVDNQFLTRDVLWDISHTIDRNRSLLDIGAGCLVHKDIALWNLLGTADSIRSVIDWDDTILGDPTDDISLMACFHNGRETETIIEGYSQRKSLPENFEKRFWLHLLRNMIFKAVIRVGAGYFTRNDNFFLIESNTAGSDLARFTSGRIITALEGLKGKRNINDL